MNRPERYQSLSHQSHLRNPLSGSRGSDIYLFKGRLPKLTFQRHEQKGVGTTIKPQKRLFGSGLQPAADRFTYSTALSKARMDPPVRLEVPIFGQDSGALAVSCGASRLELNRAGSYGEYSYLAYLKIT